MGTKVSVHGMQDGSRGPRTGGAPWAEFDTEEDVRSRIHQQSSTDEGPMETNQSPGEVHDRGAHHRQRRRKVTDLIWLQGLRNEHGITSDLVEEDIQLGNVQTIAKKALRASAGPLPCKRQNGRRKKRRIMHNVKYGCRCCNANPAIDEELEKINKNTESEEAGGENAAPPESNTRPEPANNGFSRPLPDGNGRENPPDPKLKNVKTKEQGNEERKQRRTRRMEPKEKQLPDGNCENKRRKLNPELFQGCEVVLPCEWPPLDNQAAAGTGGDARGGRKAAFGDG